MHLRRYVNFDTLSGPRPRVPSRRRVIGIDPIGNHNAKISSGNSACHPLYENVRVFGQSSSASVTLNGGLGEGPPFAGRHIVKQALRRQQCVAGAVATLTRCILFVCSLLLFDADCAVRPPFRFGDHPRMHPSPHPPTNPTTQPPIQTNPPTPLSIAEALPRGWCFPKTPFCTFLLHLSMHLTYLIVTCRRLTTNSPLARCAPVSRLFSVSQCMLVSKRLVALENPDQELI